MWRNYLNTAIRNMRRNKATTLINLVGLTFGLAVFITISSWIRYEKSYDMFHKHSERIFLVKQTLHLENDQYTTERVGGAFADAIKRRYPQVEQTLRVSSPLELVFTLELQEGEGEVNERHFVEKEVLAVDSTFCEVFSFSIIKGDEAHFLRDPYSVYLTPSVAEKYFGKENPVGKKLIIREKDFIVGGVIQEPPQNSSIRFDVILPFDIMKKLGYPIENFGGTIYYTYLLLNKPIVKDEINASLPEYLNSLYDEGLNPHQFLVPLKRVHLYGESQNYIGVYIYSVISILILLIACINFINLTTAHAYNRAREVGLRKVNGAKRRQLILQFLGETFVIVFITVYLAVILAEILVPEFGRIHDFSLHLDLSNPKFWIHILITILVITLIAGLYPAFIMSSYKTNTILRNINTTGKSGNRLRKVLVVSQFFFSIILMIVTIFAVRQLQYMHTADLGFTKENIVYIPSRGKIPAKYNLLKEDLLKTPDILGVTTGSHIPLNINIGEIEWGDKPGRRNQMAWILYAGYDFTKIFDINIQEGRYYLKDHPTDAENSIVINRATADLLNWDDPIGKDFYLWNNRYKVIGIIDNFKFFPYNLGGNALIMKFSPVNNYIFVRIKPGNKETALSFIQNSLRRYNPGFSFEYGFVSDYKISSLKDTDKFNILFGFLTFMGIFISCAGLFGLVLYATNKRTREVGIRKAMGAISSQIQRLFIRDFVKLVLIANLLAIPVAYFLTERIFRFFAYRVDLSVWVFLLAATISLLMTLLTVIHRARQASANNPADSLRYE